MQLIHFLKRPFYLTVSSLAFNLLYALLTVVLYNGVFFKHTASYNSGWLFLSCVFLCLWLALFIFCSLLFHKYIRKPLAITLVLLNSIAFYFMFIYNATLDKIMFLNILQTDVYEVRDLLNPKLFLIFICLGILPALVIYKTRITPSPVKKQLLASATASVVIAAIMLGNYQTTDDYLHSNRSLRYFLTPSNYIGSIISVIKIKARPTPDMIKIGEDAQMQRYWKNNKKNLFVFIMGETARAANFSLRGYHRPTNAPLTPYLKDIVYFQNARSCGTSTAISVPCTFSKDSRYGFEPGSEAYTENLLDVMERVGYKVLWRENNTGCQNVCDRVELEDPCKTSKFCLDEVMLDNLETKVADYNSDAFIVLHQRGSHGPAYSEHYSKEAELYKPICRQKDFPYCSKESLVNVYDNSIYYTSIFLARTIDTLQKLSSDYNTVMIYISDHGESLGENGMFLHSAPYNNAPLVQKDIPFLVWISDSFAKDFKIDKNCLQQQVKNPRSQDNIFHSVLGLSGIKTSLYIPDLDIFANCRLK